MTTTQLPLIERKEITLSCIDGNDEIAHVLLPARVCGGLAIHKGIGRTNKGYTLTHLPSSVSLVTNIRIADQEPILKELANTMDWSKSYDQTVSFWLHNPLVCEKVRALFAKLRGAQ